MNLQLKTKTQLYNTIDLLTVVHHLLTHSFQIANDNGFQFYGYPLG